MYFKFGMDFFISTNLTRRHYVKIFKSKYPYNFKLQTGEQSFKDVDWRNWEQKISLSVYLKWNLLLQKYNFKFNYALKIVYTDNFKVS